MSDAYYAMGWIVQPYRGHRCIYSGGNGIGFGMKAGFLPDAGIGIVVLTNLAGTPMTNVVIRNLYDRVLGLSRFPWNRKLLRAAARRRAASRTESGSPSGAPRTSRPRPLRAYVGRYSHPAYGSLRVRLCGNQLRLEYQELPFRVRHLSGDCFTIALSVPTGYRKEASFATDERGRIASVAIPFAPGVDPIVFSRVPSRRKLDSADAGS